MVAPDSVVDAIMEPYRAGEAREETGAMPVISIQPMGLLRDRKLYCMERLAYLDVAEVLPTPPPDMLETRRALLDTLQDIERRFALLGAHADDRDVTWLAEGFWEAE